MKTHTIRKDSISTFALNCSIVRSVIWSGVRNSKHIAVRALMLSCLLLMLSGFALGQESCSLEEVKIGYQAKTCAFFNYEFTLNGAVASGIGTGCISFDLFPNLTNKAWVGLKVNETYELEGGPGLCITQVNFDVPEGYKLYIDGIETNTIIKTNGGIIFTGDGTWEIVVRKECDCAANDPGQTSPRNGSVIWDAGLGNLTDGRSAELLSIREKVLSSAIYTPAALVYSPPIKTNEVEVLRDGSTLRQIKAPQTTIDIVANTSSEYDIKYYRPADVGQKQNGFYTFLGQPYVTWRITNPDPTTTTQLEIHKIEGGQVTNKSQYTWDPAIDSWTLKTGWISGTNYARTETRTVSYPTTQSRTETYIVKEGTTLVSKQTKTYLSYPWGEELVQEVLDPDSAALTTTYTYYENPSETHRYRKIKTITFPDGLWEKYDYDQYWNVSTIMRPWKDLSLASATESNSHLTIFGYSNSDNGAFGVSVFQRILYDVEEKIGGVTVKKTRYNRSIANIDPDMTAITESSYSESTGGVPSNLITESIATVYRFSAPQFLANRLASMVYPDGRKESYTYDKGNYITNADPALNQFVPDTNGVAERCTLINGTVTSPDGIAFKTTKETTIRDQYGNKVYNEIYVYNGTGYERIGWMVSQYDDRAHLVSSRNHKGELTSAVWVGDKKISEIDAAGVETVYEYDTLDQVKTQTKKGIAAGGGFPAQGDIKTTFTYDAEGNQTKEKIEGVGTSLMLQSEQTYDRAGRLTSEKDEAGLFTSYSYTNGGRTVTVTRPGGATEVTDNYLDRQVKTVTGSSMVAETRDYGVNADGTRYVQEFQGSAGLSSPRWTKTTQDWVDREIKVEKPSFTGNNLIETSTYNTLNQLQKRVLTANAVKVVADRLFEYDELGRENRRGLDVDASNSLTLLSTDRLTETSVVYEKVGSDWFAVTTQKSYLQDNNDTPILVTQRERLNNFTLNGTEQTVAEITEIDAAGNATVTTTKVDRAAKKTTVTTDEPDSNLNAVDIRINGLLQSSTPSTPMLAVTYAYDALGRRIGSTDPATGTTSRSYSTDTGQLISQTVGAGTINYEYYLPTHAAAGQLKAQIDAAGKKTYFNYNSRGQKTQTWGDATHPLEYVYDAYGQVTEQHTYRGGQNWGSSVWPASTTGSTDVTRWTYQESTGLPTQKEDAALKATAYTYDELGRQKTRVWARGITTTYGYDANTGEVRTVTYSDSTPALAYTYDRGGRQATITDASGSRSRTFNVEDDLQTEQITGGILNGVNVTVGFDGFLRRSSVQSTHNSTTLSSQTYGYDGTSRLQTITSGSQTVTYGYHANTGLLTSTSFTGGTNIARSYDSFGRIENITTTPGAGPAQSFVYQYNNLNQRTRVTREDNSYWSFVYNDRGELVTGKKYWSDNSLVYGNQTEFAYDTSGNRTTAKAGGNELGALRQSAYTANNLNQYSQRTVPGAVDVTGLAHSSASVTVNNLTTARKGEYFYKELTVDNSSAPSYPQISIVGARNNFGAGGEDAVTEKGGRAFLPPATESFAYDFDGNLISDGRWTYSWNAENRLIGMEAAAGVPVEAKKKLEFNYDFMGRRILKKVSVWNAGTSQYELHSETRFIYDGWTPIAEIAANNSLIRSYVWGSDLSGGLEEAGAVGGLLLVDEGGNRYQVGYDGNGNVTTLVNAATGAIASSYEYDPFGNTLKATGDYANTNPFRFSTKYTDQESGLLYYGFRFYNPQTGKWLSKDPLQEAGGTNLYAFSTNDGINAFDYLGLKKYKRSPKGKGHHIIPWSVFNGKVNDAVYEFFNSEFARIWNISYTEHNAKALNGISHKRYTALVREELEKFLGHKNFRKLTRETAEEFLHKIKNMPNSSEIRRFNDGVFDEAAESMVKKLGYGTRRAAKTSLMRALGVGARRIPRGINVLMTTAQIAFFVGDAIDVGWKKAIDNYVRETGKEADAMVTDAIRIWEKGTIQHYGKKFVELCKGLKFW